MKQNNGKLAAKDIHDLEIAIKNQIKESGIHKKNKSALEKNHAYKDYESSSAL